MKFTKLALAVSLVGVSNAANAEIMVDAQNNVFFNGAKESALVISADGTVGVNNTVLHKCEGTESNKVVKAKLGTVTCDKDFIKVRDKNGNELAKYSGYARATDGKNEERKLFDPSVAAIGSAVTGAAATSQTEAVVTETVVEKTVVIAPAAAAIPQPQPADVNEKLYTPKLGVTAQQTPAITKKNTIAQSKADAAVRQAEKEAQKYGQQLQNVGNEVVTTVTESAPTSTEKVVTTTTTQPVPGSAATATTETVIEEKPAQ